MLGIQTLEPFTLCRTGEFFFGGLAEIQVKMQAPRLNGIHLAGLTEPVEGILANCFKHAVARGAFALFENEQRFIDQSAHAIQDIDRLDIRTFAYGFRRFQGKAAVKEGKPPE